MRHKRTSVFYLGLGVLLFCLVNLSKSVVDEMRFFTVASLSSIWELSFGVKHYLADRPLRFWKKPEPLDASRLAQLELENQMLRAQIEKMSVWACSETKVKELLDIVKQLETQAAETKEKQWREFFVRRAFYLRSLARSEIMAIPAAVIYRDPASWSSSFWMNVGEEDNRILGRVVIAKNSPVVSGIALIGVVDYVGEKQSRVRLLTDSGLSPAVRAVRNGKQYLAKGEIHGSCAPLWRSRSLCLEGVGFHLNSEDEENLSSKESSILQEGDLLVTTGLDGVFPPDLQVGIVSEVTPPKAGGYAYSLKAYPKALDINEISSVFVLPPRGD